MIDIYFLSSLKAKECQEEKNSAIGCSLYLQHFISKRISLTQLKMRKKMNTTFDSNVLAF